MMSLVIGVDVGGTNTDAVIITNKNKVSSYAKTLTTKDVTSGVVNAVQQAIGGLTKTEYSATDISGINIGTTHFLNAILQRKNLARVALIRLCGPASLAVPPFCDFPEDLANVINAGYYFLGGGYQYDGTEISPVCEDEVIKTMRKIIEGGVKNVVIAGIFSCVRNDQEIKVKEIIQRTFPGISITLSHEVGQLGQLERENASILNESLKPLSRKTIFAFHEAFSRIKKIGPKCPFYLTQNDGTILKSASNREGERTALDFPVLTLSSGPTNSMRGAAHLSNLTDAIVIDIGGTTTDIGVLMKGFPRLASTRVKVGGVNTNFRMPDVISIALGGGSLVKYHDTGRVTVGPTGVGCNINQDALVFGGTVLTATDVAVAAGYTSNIGEVSRVEHLKPSDRDKAVQEIKRMVESVIDQVKVQAEDQPVILVGGGSILLDRDQPLKGASKIEFPDYFEVANAVGAALCKVSGMVDGVFEVDAEERDSALANVKQRARREAILNGADPDTIEVLEITATQLSYLKGNQTRICIKVVGDLADGHALTREAFDISKLDVSPLDGPSLAPTTEGRATCVGECLDPVIDANGDWLMQPYDVECVAIGAGILGCGGGGSPYIGKLKAINILKAGKTMRVIHPDRLGTTPDLQGDGAVIAFMGAPVILYEKLAANTETENAAGALKAFIANKDQAKVVEDKGVTIVFNAKELLNKTEKSSQFFSVALCAEVGGANSIEPLAFGALNGIPVVDADAMGRAFPKLQMTVPFVKGCKAYPAAVADEKGNVSVISQARNPQDVENVFREKCVEYGCASGVSFTFTCDEIKQHFVRYTISRARSLGDAVLRARRDKTCPLDCIVSREGGVVILRAGKIIRVDREISEGFSKGSMLLKGDAQESLQINFQNENYIVFSKENGANVVRACVPDLISVVNCDSGEPIATEEIRYGLRVAVLAMPCPPQWTTPEALSVVGPAAFGYEEIEFKSVGRYMEFPPIPKL